MIYTNSIANAKKDDYDEIWAIVRSMKRHDSKIAHQVQALSPSYALFITYLDLKKAGKWNKETFDNIYKPQFLKEMQNLQAQQMLDELCRLDKLGKKICLVCFCNDYSLCHRSLVAELLIAKGCNVITEQFVRYF